MTRDLFLNEICFFQSSTSKTCKLKSTAHLQWKSLTYRTLMVLLEDTCDFLVGWRKPFNVDSKRTHLPHFPRPVLHVQQEMPMK